MSAIPVLGAYCHVKEYRVLIARRPDSDQLSTWRRGVVLQDGYRTAPAQVSVESFTGKGTWLRIILREGRKRQIRETGQILSLPVVKIIRVLISSPHLGSLKPRSWRYLSHDEIQILKGTKQKKRKSKKTKIWVFKRFRSL